MSTLASLLLRARMPWLACPIVLIFAVTSRAQLDQKPDDDLIDLVRRRQLIEMQRVETEVRQVLQEAQTLLQNAPAKAAEKLQGALIILNNDTLLSKERRESFKRTIDERLRAAENRIARLAAKSKAPTASGKHSNDADKAASDHRAPHESTESARDLAMQAKEQINARLDGSSRGQKLKKDRERNLAGALTDIDTSATAPGGDMDFPKNWKERTKGRSSGVELTAKEKSILQTLNSRVAVDFKNTRFEDVIQYLQDETGQPIILDREGMKEVDASYDSPVTLTVKGATLRTVLRRILADLGLAYVIRDECIQITSGPKAKDMMVMRRYYVGDLLANMGGFSTPSTTSGIAPTPVTGIPIVPIVPFGNGVAPIFPQPVQNLQAQQNAEQIRQTVEQLRAMIIDTADSQSWRDNGGAGTISFHAPTMSFLIRQSAEVHGLLSAGLLK